MVDWTLGLLAMGPSLQQCACDDLEEEEVEDGGDGDGFPSLCEENQQPAL